MIDLVNYIMSIREARSAYITVDEEQLSSGVKFSDVIKRNSSRDHMIQINIVNPNTGLDVIDSFFDVPPRGFVIDLNTRRMPLSFLRSRILANAAGVVVHLGTSDAAAHIWDIKNCQAPMLIIDDTKDYLSWSLGMRRSISLPLVIDIADNSADDGTWQSRAPQQFVSCLSDLLNNNSGCQLIFRQKKGSSKKVIDYEVIDDDGHIVVEETKIFQ